MVNVCSFSSGMEHVAQALRERSNDYVAESVHMQTTLPRLDVSVACDPLAARVQLERAVTFYEDVDAWADSMRTTMGQPRRTYSFAIAQREAMVRARMSAQRAHTMVAAREQLDSLRQLAADPRFASDTIQAEVNAFYNACQPKRGISRLEAIAAAQDEDGP